MASDNLDPNLPINQDEEQHAFRFAPSAETVEQYMQRKRELSAREQRIEKVARRVGFFAKVITFLWFASFVLAGLSAVAIVYVIYHFVSKLW